MRLALFAFLTIVLVPSFASAFRVIEHPSRQYVLLEDREVPGTNHTASELLNENSIPAEVHSLELIREAGDQYIDTAWRLNYFYFAFGSITHAHGHDCTHHDLGHQQCTDQVEYCWTDYESRCGYEWEYVCRYINGKQVCRYEQVYRCRQYPIRRCIWQNVPISYYESHSHEGDLPHFQNQQPYSVRVVFPENAPLTGNRTERFTVSFNGNVPTIKFDHVLYFYFIDSIVNTENGVTIYLGATSREELARPDNVSLSLDDSGFSWNWLVEDQIYGVGDIRTSYHLIVQSCFLFFCDKKVEHSSNTPFDIDTSPLQNDKTWSIQLDVERSGKFLPTSIKFAHKYEYKDGELRKTN